LLRFILKVNEDTHLILENLCGVCHRIVRLNAAVGYHFKDDPIIIGALSEASISDSKIDFLDRRKNGVDKYRVDRRALFPVPFCRNIAAPQLRY
jgi:hypothetical protein